MRARAAARVAAATVLAGAVAAGVQAFADSRGDRPEPAAKVIHLSEEPPETVGQRPRPHAAAAQRAEPERRLVVRGVTVYDGSAHPPQGQQDIVIDGARIAEVVPAAPEDEERPHGADAELDARGMYVLPGLIELDGAAAEAKAFPDPGYAYKLWLAHGVTTVRGFPLFPSEWRRGRDEKRRSARGEMPAPRLFDGARLGERRPGGRVRTRSAVRRWVAWARRSGIDSLSLDSAAACRPRVLRAAIREARRRGLATSAEFTGRCVRRSTVRIALKAGVHELRVSCRTSSRWRDRG